MENLSVDIVIYLLGLAAMWGSLQQRIKDLEKKVEKHNNLVERMTAVEKKQELHELEYEFLCKEVHKIEEEV